MTDFELTFVVSSLTEELVEELYDQDLDVFAGHDFADRPYLTVTAPGRSAPAAAKAALTLLNTLGLEVEFVQHDLVNRTAIAERLAVTRAAVGQWVSGKRGAGDPPFPAPFNDAAGGVWLWGDVERWAEATGRAELSGLAYPTRGELDKINAFIRNGCRDDAPVYQTIVRDFAFTTSRSHLEDWYWHGLSHDAHAVVEKVDFDVPSRQPARLTKRR